MGEKSKAAKRLEEAREAVEAIKPAGTSVGNFDKLEEALQKIIAAIEDIDRRLEDD